MASNRFTNLRKVKSADRQPPAVEPEKNLTFNSTSTTSEVARRGRPRAKRSSNDFAQATAYIKKDTYTAVKHLLLDQKKEYSILVQELLDEWLKKQN